MHRSVVVLLHSRVKQVTAVSMMKGLVFEYIVRNGTIFGSASNSKAMIFVMIHSFVNNTFTYKKQVAINANAVCAWYIFILTLLKQIK